MRQVLRPVTDQEIDAIASKFDVKYYASEYPDLLLSEEELLSHFCRVGWHEGRNPNPFFDTVTYLIRNPDVCKAGVNPYYHYLKDGIAERRYLAPSASPSTQTMLLLGHSVVNWVELLQGEVDLPFYQAQILSQLPSDASLVAHYAYRGWREGLAPNPTFDVTEWQRENLRAARFFVNPLVVRHELSRVTSWPRGSGAEAASETIANDGPAVGARTSEVSRDSGCVAAQSENAVNLDPQVGEIAAEFDEDYYKSVYGDVVAADVNPLLHYFYTGWREGRNPSRAFDTNYYLNANDDVKSADINPLYHFITIGRREGRAPLPPGGYRRRVLQSAKEPEERSKHYEVTSDKPLSIDVLRRRIRTALKSRRGLVVSFSHDCYIRSIGGTQIFISDEQKQLNELGFGYIHLSPHRPMLSLAEASATFAANLVLDGKFVGLTFLSQVRELVAEWMALTNTATEACSYVVLHSLLGFDVDDVANMAASLRAADVFYWLHDYSSVCEGFNLLRNDLEFCGSPPPDSMACRVCVYGNTRAAHLNRISRLFSQVPMRLVAPSKAALQVWQRAIGNADKQREAAVLSMEVLPHWELRESRQPPIASQRGGKPNASRVERRPRIAFVGAPVAAKGWPLYEDLTNQIIRTGKFEFFHFAKDDTALPGVQFVKTEISAADRFATIRLLKEHRIEFVAILSPWPETFSFVAYEALVSGCFVLCLEDGGNIAAQVRRTGRGKVFRGATELTEFFLSGAAAKHVRWLRKQKGQFEIVESGGTAAFIRRSAIEEGG